MGTIADLGISMKEVTDALLATEVRLATESFDKLLATVARRGREAWARRVNRMTYDLPAAMAGAVADVAGGLGATGKGPPALAA